VLALPWSDVDSDGAVLRITGSLQRIGPGLPERVEVKTATSRRSVTLPPLAVATLKAHRASQLERRLAAGASWAPGDWIFDRGDGNPVDTADLSVALQRSATKAGVEGLRLHDLRHAFATAALSQGVHPKIVSEALGHASIVITLDRYSHVLPSMGSLAADAIQRAFEGASV